MDGQAAGCECFIIFIRDLHSNLSGLPTHVVRCFRALLRGLKPETQETV